MSKIAMILRRSPYGDINAAEAVRHAMGGAADELAVSLVLVDGGVLLVSCLPEKGRMIQEQDLQILKVH